MTIDEEFPILEYLILGPRMTDSEALTLPETLQAPNLHHLTLNSFAFPIQSPLQPTATGLVTLFLIVVHPRTYFQPNVLLQWISFIPQLETLTIGFRLAIPNHDVERQLTHTPITTHITLPNLCFFLFQGISAYLEAVVFRITTPRLETLQIQLFNQLTFSVPCLQQFVNTTENLRLDDAVIMFKDKEINVLMSPRGADLYPFIVKIGCGHLNWQVSSVAQIFNGLSQGLSVVEHLDFRHEVHNQSSEEHNDVDQIERRNLLRPFSNVKTLRIEDGLVEQLSCCLRLEDGELPLELFPELQELTYSGSGNTDNAFISFIDACQNAGRPVTLVHRR